MTSSASHNACPFRYWIWLLVVCSFCCGVCPAQDVIVHLRNGDRITGRVLSDSTNGLVLATAFAEKLSIDKSLVDRQESLPKPQPPTPPPAAKKPAAASPPPPATPASGVVSELVVTNKPTLAQTAGGAAKPADQYTFAKFLDAWRGEAQLGANLAFSTKDRQAFTGRLKLTHNHGLPRDRSLRNILGYDMSYSTTDGVLSDNRMDGTWKIEYDLNKRFLVYNAAAAGYHEIRGIDLQYEFGPGLGYKWVVLTNFVFKNELGGDYQKQYFVNDREDSRYSLRLAEDSWWQITPKIRWDQRVEFFPQVEDLSEFRVRVESNLSYLLKQNLTLTLGVINLYETDVPAGVSQNDLQIRSLLGIKF